MSTLAGERGHPVVVMAQQHSTGTQQVDLSRHEFSQAALDGLAIDVSPPGRSQDRYIRARSPSKDDQCPEVSFQRMEPSGVWIT